MSLLDSPDPTETPLNQIPELSVIGDVQMENMSNYPDQDKDFVISLHTELEKSLEKTIAASIDSSRVAISPINSALELSYEQIAQFMTIGKHIRPHFAWAGWLISLAKTPIQTDIEKLAQLGAACEFLHACALIHDDIIDKSSTRRKLPTVHENFAQYSKINNKDSYLENTQSEIPPSATTETTADNHLHFGYGMAILIGDLALSIANHKMSDLAQTVPALWAPWHTMQYEVLTGQILDISYATSKIRDIDISTQINSLKTSSYTFMRPLQLGATLAQAPDEIIQLLLNFGSALGSAFQLQDDILGTFSYSAQTGKSQGDDLISGKSTVLIIEALALAKAHKDPTILPFLESSIGNIRNKQHLEQVTESLINLGAKTKVENKISHYFNQAQHYLHELAEKSETNNIGIIYLAFLMEKIVNRIS